MDQILECPNVELINVNNKTSKYLYPQYALLWIVPLAFLTLFYFYPLATILGKSFVDLSSLAQLLEIVRQPYVTKTLWFTIWQATLSTILTLAIGLPGAYILAHYNFWGKSILRAITAIPFVLPTVVVAASFTSTLGPNGWMNRTLMTWLNLETAPIVLNHTLWAILIAHVFYNTTIILRLVGDYWTLMDPKMVQAARCLGATRLRAFLGITLPLLTPAIVSAALLVFIFDFTSFGVILILGGPMFSTLEVAIYRQTINFFDLEMAAWLSVIQLICTLGLTVLYARLSRKIHRPLKTNRLRSIRRQQHNWKTRMSVGILITILIIVLVMPLATLAFSSVYKFEPDRGERENVSAGFTLSYYRELFVNRRNSIFFVTPIETIMFSLRNAVITTISALAIGLPATWVLTRKTRLTQLLEPILMLPLGTSAVTLGLGLLLVFSRTPFNMRTSSLLVPLAHTLVAFPFVIRSLLPSWTIINPQIRKAAAMLGANPIQVWREIDLPIIGRAILVAGAFAFTISIGEFGATILLSRPEFTTVPMAIYRYLSLPGALNYGQAMALSTILMIFCGISIFCIEAIRPNAISEF